MMLRKFSAALFALLALLATPPSHAASTFTANVCMVKPTPGDATTANSWGTLLNTSANIIDGITSAVSSISVAGSSNVVLTFNCGTLDQTDAAHFIFTGALTGNIDIIWPASRGRTFSVTNSTTGAFTITLGANNGSNLPAGGTVVVPQGYTGLYYSDGTNVLTRETSGGLTMAANSLAMNVTASAGPGADIAVPSCFGASNALQYTPGTGISCGTISGGGGGGGGGGPLSWGGVQAASFVASPNFIYCVDTTSGGLNMTLPATPQAGNEIDFSDCNATFATNNLTILNNGNNLMRVAQNMQVNQTNASGRLIYTGVTYGWIVFH